MPKKTRPPYYERKVVVPRGGSPHAWLVLIPAADHARRPAETAAIAASVDRATASPRPADIALVLDRLRERTPKYVSRTSS